MLVEQSCVFSTNVTLNVKRGLKNLGRNYDIYFMVMGLEFKLSSNVHSCLKKKITLNVDNGIM